MGRAINPKNKTQLLKFLKDLDKDIRKWNNLDKEIRSHYEHTLKNIQQKSSQLDKLSYTENEIIKRINKISVKDPQLQKRINDKYGEVKYVDEGFEKQQNIVERKWQQFKTEMTRDGVTIPSDLEETFKLYYFESRTGLANTPVFEVPNATFNKEIIEIGNNNQHGCIKQGDFIIAGVFTRFQLDYTDVFKKYIAGMQFRILIGRIAEKSNAPKREALLNLLATKLKPYRLDNWSRLSEDKKMSTIINAYGKLFNKKARWYIFTNDEIVDSISDLYKNTLAFAVPASRITSFVSKHRNWFYFRTASENVNVPDFTIGVSYGGPNSIIDFWKLGIESPFYSLHNFVDKEFYHARQQHNNRYKWSEGYTGSYIDKYNKNVQNADRTPTDRFLEVHDAIFGGLSI